MTLNTQHVDASFPIVPGAVDRPPVVPANQTAPFAATVSWNPPSAPNGLITQYIVNLVLVSSGRMGVVRRQAVVPMVINPDCVIGGTENVDRNISVTGNPPPTSLTLDTLSK